MKKSIVLIICFILLGVTNSFASSWSSYEERKHSWELGTELSYIKYDEPGIMEEDGIMWGMLGSLTYRNNWMLKGEGRFSYGQVDYSGQLSDGSSYTITSIDDYMLEFRGLAGYDFFVTISTTLTPYAGFGYRYLNDDISFDPAGYERESNYYYSPIGLETLTELQDGWSVGTIIEYDIFWKGLQKSHLSDAVITLNDIENDQNDGYGIRGSIKFQKQTETANFVIEPFIRYWNIDESKESAVTLAGTIIGTGVEPKNNSMEIGIKFAGKF